MEILEYIKFVVFERMSTDIGWILIICLLLSVAQIRIHSKLDKLEKTIKELKK